MQRNDLILAISDRNLNGVIEFIHQGGNINGFSHYGMPPLVFALLSTHKLESGTIDEIISLLIDARADVNACLLNNDITATMLAIKKNRRDKILLKFINAGTDVNIKTKKLQTILIYAIINNCGKTVIKALIDKGSDVNITYERKTPLYYSVCVRKDPGIIEILLDAQAVIINHEFQSPLLAVCCKEICTIDTVCKYKRVTDILIKSGMNLNVRDGWGDTIIHLATCSYVLYLAKRYGVQIDEENIAEKSPLFKSLTGKDTVKVNNLLLIGADPNRKDPYGNTPLHYSDVVMYKLNVINLVFHGANLHALNNSGETPIYYNFRDWGRWNFSEEFLEGMETLVLHYLLYENEGFVRHAISVLDVDILRLSFSGFIYFCRPELNNMQITLLTNELSLYEFCHRKMFYKEYIRIQLDEYLIDHHYILRHFPLFRDIILIRLQDNSRKNFKLKLVASLNRVFVSVPFTIDRNKGKTIFELSSFSSLAKYLSYRQLYALIKASYR